MTYIDSVRRFPELPIELVLHIFHFAALTDQQVASSIVQTSRVCNVVCTPVLHRRIRLQRQEKGWIQLGRLISTLSARPTLGEQVRTLSILDSSWQPYVTSNGWRLFARLIPLCPNLAQLVLLPTHPVIALLPPDSRILGPPPLVELHTSNTRSMASSRAARLHLVYHHIYTLYNLLAFTDASVFPPGPLENGGSNNNLRHLVLSNPNYSQYEDLVSTLSDAISIAPILYDIITRAPQLERLDIVYTRDFEKRVSAFGLAIRIVLYNLNRRWRRRTGSTIGKGVIDVADIRSKIPRLFEEENVETGPVSFQSFPDIVAANKDEAYSGPKPTRRVRVRLLLRPSLLGRSISPSCDHGTDAPVRVIDRARFPWGREQDTFQRDALGKLTAKLVSRPGAHDDGASAFWDWIETLEELDSIAVPVG